MADTNETSDDIVAEMRFHGQQNIDAEKDKPEYGILTVEGRITKSYADCLEAAHRRERGDSAKLREAVVLALSLLDLEGGVPSKAVSQKDIDFMKSALAAPARNCDMGTPAEQTARFAEFCKSYRHSDMPKCAGCPLEDIPDGTGCSQAWGQMPYETEATDGE